MIKRHLTFNDMFAGIGGFRPGMEQAGHKCAGFTKMPEPENYNFNKLSLNLYEEGDY